MTDTPLEEIIDDGIEQHQAKDSLTADLIRRFVRLSEERARMKARLKSVEEDLADIHGDLMRFFERAGIQNLSAGGFTAFVERKVFAGFVNSREELIKGLKRARLGDYVRENYNDSQLSAYVRELDANGRKMPKSLIGKLKITEVFKVKARRS